MPSIPFKIGVKSIQLPEPGWISIKDLDSLDNNLTSDILQSMIDRLDRNTMYRQIILTKNPKKSRILKIV